MIIVDRALERREAEGRPIRVALVGAGFMGRGVANQIINSTTGMRLVAIANRTLAQAERAYREAGVTQVRVVEDARAVDRAITDGVAAVTSDYRAVVEAGQVDAVIEATGAVEFGCHVICARHRPGQASGHHERRGRRHGGPDPAPHGPMRPVWC